VRSPPIAALASEFGGVLPHSASLIELLTALDDFSSQWDNRHGGERNFARRIALGRAKEELVLQVAAALGLYVPYQHVEALRMLGLPYQSKIEMYGVHPHDMDRRFAPDIQPHHYLQEIRSTIRALRSLVRSLTEPHTPSPADI